MLIILLFFNLTDGNFKFSVFQFMTSLMFGSSWIVPKLLRMYNKCTQVKFFRWTSAVTWKMQQRNSRTNFLNAAPPWSVSLQTSNTRLSRRFSSCSRPSTKATILSKGSLFFHRLYFLHLPFSVCPTHWPNPDTEGVSGGASSRLSEASQVAALARCACHSRASFWTDHQQHSLSDFRGKHFDHPASAAHYRTRADRKHMSPSGEVISCSTPETAAISA